MVLRIDSLTHRYPNGTTALAGVSLAVRVGERVAVMGPNGAGKSTLARHLIGIARPTSGTVEVDGRDASRLGIAELARSVGFVFQNPDDQLHAATVAKEVSFGPRNLGFPADRRTALTAWALRVTGLTAEADSHPRHLSFGERKRVALASVLAMDTPVIVLDEPTTGQDHRSVTLLEELMGDLHRKERRSSPSPTTRTSAPRASTGSSSSPKVACGGTVRWSAGSREPRIRPRPPSNSPR